MALLIPFDICVGIAINTPMYRRSLGNWDPIGIGWSFPRQRSNIDEGLSSLD